jgi:Putative transposase of IS4/5 family (DUF4096)
VLRRKLSRGQVVVRLANMPPCLVGMEACVGVHHLSRQLLALGHDVKLVPAQYVKPFLKGQKNDSRDAEAVAEALSDCEWNVIRPMLPNKARGIPRVDDRRILNGIFWVLRSGAPWRDLLPPAPQISGGAGSVP